MVARAPCCGVSLGFSDWWTGLDLGDGGAALPRDNIRRVGLIDSSLSSTLAPSSRGESSCECDALECTENISKEI